MLRRLRFAVRPGWLALHVVAAALIVTMVLLGRWQLTVSERKHFSIQNFGYAIQWWAFSGFVAVMWVRAMRDAMRRVDAPQLPGSAETPAVTEAPVAYRRYVMPQQPVAPVDDVHAAYNDYLSRLADSDADVNADKAERHPR